MSEVLDSLLAQCFQVTGNVSWTITDQGGVARSATIQSASKYYRVFLAEKSETAGTNLAPIELLNKITTAINASYWLVSLTTTGLVRFKYLGTGTGTITLDAVLATILGMSSLTVGPLATNATFDGTYQPTHCVFCSCLSGDTGWRRVAPKGIYGVMPNGSVFGFSSYLGGQKRTFSIDYLPKDQTTKTTLNTNNPTDLTYSTPALPATSRYKTSITSEPAQSAPWSLLDTINNQVDQTLGVCFGNLQALIASTAGNTFDVCFISPETLQKSENVCVTVPMLETFYSLKDCELLGYSFGVSR
jgi:hypothetical protein